MDVDAPEQLFTSAPEAESKKTNAKRPFASAAPGREEKYLLWEVGPCPGRTLCGPSTAIVMPFTGSCGTRGRESLMVMMAMTHHKSLLYAFHCDTVRVQPQNMAMIQRNACATHVRVP